MEQTVKKYGKETLDYGTNKHDFVADDELTVTITLSEYRELVKSVATKESDIAKATSATMAKEAEIRKLKEQIDRLLGGDEAEND